MDILEAVKRSIRSYYEGESFKSISKLKPVKYDKAYFDQYEEGEEVEEDETEGEGL